MFATLIVQLPSIFDGNDLIVRHGNKTKTVKFDCEESQYSLIYAAHYADCQHEVCVQFGEVWVIHHCSRGGGYLGKNGCQVSADGKGQFLNLLKSL